MKVVTWGSGGTYATLMDCYDAVVFDDHVEARQVGSNSEAGIITIKNQQGFSFTVKGNKKLYTWTNTCPWMIRSSTVVTNGDFTLDNLNIIYTPPISGRLFLVSSTIAVNNTHWFTVKNCTIYNTAQGFILFGRDYGGSFSKVKFFNNYVKLSVGTDSIFKNYNLGASTDTFYVEDNTFHNVALYTGNLRNTYPTTTNYLANFYLKRNYFIDLPTTFISTQTSSVIINPETSFSTNATSDVPVNHQNIPLSDVTFQSIDPLSELFMVPRESSILATDADQTTNIVENVLGHNLISSTLVRRSGGCMSLPLIVPNPTITSGVQKQTGLELKWTDAVITGYSKTYIYWEFNPQDSNFKTPKATLNFGVQEFIIPYTELSNELTVYIKIVHGV